MSYARVRERQPDAQRISRLGSDPAMENRLSASPLPIAEQPIAVQVPDRDAHVPCSLPQRVQRQPALGRLFRERAIPLIHE